MSRRVHTLVLAVLALVLAAGCEPRTVWDRLAACESGERWSYNGRSGYDGGLQFAPSTWRAMGGTDYAPYAWGATREQQIEVAERLLKVQGWRAWPTCSRRLGLR